MGLVECVIGMNRDVRQSMLEQRQQLSKNQQSTLVAGCASSFPWIEGGTLSTFNRVLRVHRDNSFRAESVGGKFLQVPKISPARARTCDRAYS